MGVGGVGGGVDLGLHRVECMKMSVDGHKVEITSTWVGGMSPDRILLRETMGVGPSELRHQSVKSPSR